MAWRRNRPALGAAVAMLTAATVAQFAISALAAGNTGASRAQVLASISLTDDAGGTALFPGTALAPNRPVSRCVQIAYSGSAAADGPGVRLAARKVSGTLVPRLAVAVEVGTGGGFTGCAGFRGHAVYAGRLAGLAAGAGVATGWTPSPGDARTYRITVTLAPGSAAGAATATLEWSADSALLPQPAAPTATTLAPRHPSPRPEVTVPATAPADLRAVESGSGTLVRSRIVRIIRGILMLAGRGGRDSKYPLALLLLLLLFLLLQRSIDRRDPKLALAPLAEDRYAYVPADGDDHYVLAHPATATVRLVRPAVPAPASIGGDRGHA